MRHPESCRIRGFRPRTPKDLEYSNKGNKKTDLSQEDRPVYEDSITEYYSYNAKSRVIIWPTGTFFSFSS